MTRLNEKASKAICRAPDHALLDDDHSFTEWRRRQIDGNFEEMESYGKPRKGKDA